MSFEYESVMLVGNYYDKLPTSVKEKIKNIDEWCYDNDMEMFTPSVISNEVIIGFPLNETYINDFDLWVEHTKKYFNKFKKLTEIDAKIISTIHCY